MFSFSVELYFHETQIQGEKIRMVRHDLEKKCGDLGGRGGRLFNSVTTGENLIERLHI